MAHLERISRRQSLYMFAASAALPAMARAQTPPTAPAQDFSIQRDLGVNLDQKAVYDFLSSPAANLSMPPTPLAGYHLAKCDPIIVGSRPSPLSMFYSMREQYSILRNNTDTIGRFSVDVLYEQPLDITIKSFLLVKDGLDSIDPSLEGKIIDAFSKYPIGGDPMSYAASRMVTGMTQDMFAVRQTVELIKKPNNYPHAARPYDDKQKQAMLKLFNFQNASSPVMCRLFVKTDDLKTLLKQSNITAKFMKEDFVGRPEPQTYRGTHTQEVSSPANASDIEHAVDSIAGQESLNDCGAAPRTEKQKIALLTGWPEFQVVWKDVEVKIGCVRVVISIPIPQSRLVGVFLYVYAIHSNSLTQNETDKLKICLGVAAISGTVIGIVFEDPEAGYAAFQEGFQTCCVNLAVNVASCLAPGIALITESTTWVPPV